MEDEDFTSPLDFASLSGMAQDADVEVQAQIKNYSDMLAKGAERMRQQRIGPSNSEFLLSLAKAFGTPTNTGSFGERMALVANTLGGQERAQREAEMARADMLEKLGLQGAEFGVTAAQSRANRLATLMARQQTTNIAAEKAKRPIFRGTEKLNDGTIVAIYEDPATGGLTKQPVGKGEQQLMPTTVLSGGKPVFRMGSTLVQADGTPVTEVDKPPVKLSPTEIGLVDETTKRVNAGKEGLISLNRAIELNSTALEGSLTGLRKSVGALFSSDDPAYVATEELDKTVIGSALTQMKTIFGANPAEGERKILLDMQGSSNQPRAVRERIFQSAKAAVQRRMEADAKMLTDVRSGSFGRVQPAAPSKPGKPRILNWK